MDIITRTARAAWLVIAVMGVAGCSNITDTVTLGTIGATLVGGQSPTHELEQIYYLGVFDPQEQIPPTVYRVRVHGQASFISFMRFGSGWVPAQVIDSLGTGVGFDDAGNIEITPAGGEAPPTFETGRGLMMFGPEGFRPAPRQPPPGRRHGIKSGGILQCGRRDARRGRGSHGRAARCRAAAVTVRGAGSSQGRTRSSDRAGQGRHARVDGGAGSRPMNARWLPMFGAAAAALGGCAVMTIDVDVYKGPLSNHEDVQTEQMAVMAIGAKPLLIKLRDNLEELKRDTPRLPLRGMSWYKEGFIGDGPNGRSHFKDDNAIRVNAILALYADQETRDLSEIFAEGRDALSDSEIAWDIFLDEGISITVYAADRRRLEAVVADRSASAPSARGEIWLKACTGACGPTATAKCHRSTRWRKPAQTRPTRWCCLSTKKARSRPSTAPSPVCR